MSQEGPRGGLLGTHTKRCHEDDCVDVQWTLIYFFEPSWVQQRKKDRERERKKESWWLVWNV